MLIICNQKADRAKASFDCLWSFPPNLYKLFYLGFQITVMDWLHVLNVVSAAWYTHHKYMQIVLTEVLKYKFLLKYKLYSWDGCCKSCLDNPKIRSPDISGNPNRISRQIASHILCFIYCFFIEWDIQYSMLFIYLCGHVHFRNSLK